MRRWTNGDFIPRNMLINANHEVRLIDFNSLPNPPSPPPTIFDLANSPPSPPKSTITSAADCPVIPATGVFISASTKSASYPASEHPNPSPSTPKSSCFASSANLSRIPHAPPALPPLTPRLRRPLPPLHQPAKQLRIPLHPFLLPAKPIRLPNHPLQRTPRPLQLPPRPLRRPRCPPRPPIATPNLLWNPNAPVGLLWLLLPSSPSLSSSLSPALAFLSRPLR